MQPARRQNDESRRNLTLEYGQRQKPPVVRRGILIAFGLTVAFVCSIIALFVRPPKTRYAPSFTEARFKSVVNNDNLSTVLRKVGHPLEVSIAPGGTRDAKWERFNFEEFSHLQIDPSTYQIILSYSEPVA